MMHGLKFFGARQYTENIPVCTAMPIENIRHSYSYSDTPSKKCHSAVMSSRAYTSVVAEAYANGVNESGGIMLGAIDGGIGYIVEATDPGFDAEHTPTIHEMNKRYVNYIYRVLSRIYKKELTLIGFWHRHPGKFNRFSSLDDAANLEYARTVGGGTLSFILNFAPAPKLSCYYFDLDDGMYHPVKLTVSDKLLEKGGFTEYASESELLKRAKDMQNEMKGYA